MASLKDLIRLFFSINEINSSQVRRVDDFWCYVCTFEELISLMEKNTFIQLKKGMPTWRMQSSFHDRWCVKRVDCAYSSDTASDTDAQSQQRVQRVKVNEFLSVCNTGNAGVYKKVKRCQFAQ